MKKYNKTTTPKSYVIVDGKKVPSEYRKAQMRAYNEANYEAILKYQNEYKTIKFREDPINRIERSIKARISYALRNNGWKLGSKLHLLVGLPYEDYLKWIEAQWEEGMSWENYGHRKGQWCVEHFIPISSAENEEEVYKLFYFKNTRPLWQDENVRKRNKILDK